MLLSELIEQLEAIQDAYPDRDPKVSLAIQPAWPFEYSIHSVTPVSVGDQRGGETLVVYLSEGAQIGYLPGAARDAVW